MMYEKPNVDVVEFDNDSVFMTDSMNIPSSADEALRGSCGGYNGAKTNNFSCSDFGGYNASNPPKQNSQVTIAGGTYIFDYKGNHWKLHKGN